VVVVVVSGNVVPLNVNVVVAVAWVTVIREVTVVTTALSADVATPAAGLGDPVTMRNPRPEIRIRKMSRRVLGLELVVLKLFPAP
jgi:hypothetical protein